MRFPFFKGIGLSWREERLLVQLMVGVLLILLYGHGRGLSGCFSRACIRMVRVRIRTLGCDYDLESVYLRGGTLLRLMRVTHPKKMYGMLRIGFSAAYI